MIWDLGLGGFGVRVVGVLAGGGGWGLGGWGPSRGGGHAAEVLGDFVLAAGPPSGLSI